MEGNITFTIIKPDAVKKGYIGAILHHINKAGFKIISMKLKQLSKEDASSFYKIHKEKPFFQELTNFMSSNQSMVLVLEKKDAVNSWRETIGATNPSDADGGTIRKLYATSLGENAVHGSDSDENAKKEIAFFFSDAELITNN